MEDGMHACMHAHTHVRECHSHDIKLNQSNGPDWDNNMAVNNLQSSGNYTSKALGILSFTQSKWSLPRPWEFDSVH